MQTMSFENTADTHEALINLEEVLCSQFQNTRVSESSELTPQPQRNGRQQRRAVTRSWKQEAHRSSQRRRDFQIIKEGKSSSNKDTGLRRHLDF